MQVEHVRPAVLRLTLHAYEIAALISTVRWVAEGGGGKLPTEAVEQLREILASYDRALTTREA